MRWRPATSYIHDSAAKGNSHCPWVSPGPSGHHETLRFLCCAPEPLPQGPASWWLCTALDGDALRAVPQFHCTWLHHCDYVCEYCLFSKPRLSSSCGAPAQTFASKPPKRPKLLRPLREESFCGLCRSTPRLPESPVLARGRCGPPVETTDEMAQRALMLSYAAVFAYA